jgi:putative PIN family toxin of toxin-antitoxin system
VVVTFDTNIWISALVFRRGNPYTLLEMALEGFVEVAISDPILTETRRVLRDKFHLPNNDIDESISIVLSCARRVDPSRTIDAVPNDDADNRILECAVESASVCIVTGDADLLRLKAFEGIRIVRPSDLLGELRTGAEPNPL